LWDLSKLGTEQTTWLPLIVIGASLLGSWHCAGMCGAVACLASRKGQSHLYHLGRMLSYLSLGTIAGLIGKSTLLSAWHPIRIAAGVLIALLLVASGVHRLFPNLTVAGARLLPSQWQRFWNSVSRTVYQGINRYELNHFAIGFLTGFLPCGWLYSFVGAAALTASPAHGALTMLCFWVGTVPALALMSSGWNRITPFAPKQLRQATAILLIASGLYSLTAHFM